MLGLVALAAVAVRQARAAGSRGRSLDPPPLDVGELGPIVVTPGSPLVLDGDFGIVAPPTALDRVGEFLGGAVDQVKDALKGLGLWSKKVPEKYRALFAMTGAQYRLPPGLLEAVAYRESRFRDDIIDGRVRSSAGAVGIMQIVPKWHPAVGEAGALDPLRAVPYAASYLRSLFERFGSWRQALAAYNWGPANQVRDAADKIIGDDWPEETRIYVAEISANAGLA